MLQQIRMTLLAVANYGVPFVLTFCDDKLKMAPIKLALFRTALPFLANKHLYLVNSRLDLVNPNFDLLNPRIDLVNTSSDLVNQRVDLVYTIYIYVGGALPRNRSRTGTIVVL